MTRTETTRLLVDTVQGITVASFSDPMIVSQEAFSELDEQLQSLIDEIPNPNPKLLLNFREVRIMSSTMLAILIKLSRKLARVDGRLKLCGISPDLMVIFKISRFDRIFEIHSEEWAALDAF